MEQNRFPLSGQAKVALEKALGAFSEFELKPDSFRLEQRNWQKWLAVPVDPELQDYTD